MIRPTLIAAMLACAAPIVPAAVAPAMAADARLMERPYDSAQIVRVEGRASVQTTIRFGDDETIENVAVGDSQAWQVTPNKRANLLFVKPLADRAGTNMTVVTTRRTYLFDLVASPAHRAPVYILSFTYPQDDSVQLARTEAGAVLPGVPSNMEMAAADPGAVVDPADLNFAWGQKGDPNLMPQRVFDDGGATFLSWAPGMALPAVLVKDFEGTEGPVNFSVRGDMIVVDGVPREIVLRSGDDVATLTNNGPVRPVPQPPSQAALTQNYANNQAPGQPAPSPAEGK